MIVLGDSLWIQLFKQEYYRRVYVDSSYSEEAVDAYIGRVLPTEITRTDWQLMICKESLFSDFST